MRPRNGDFGIFPRRSRKTVFFYFWIYDKDGNRKFRSTGKKDYNEALRYCRSLQIKGMLHQGTSFSFDTYTKDFFDYEKCPYIRNRLLRGYSYGRTWAKRRRSLLTKVIRPHFSKTDIRAISTKMIDDFILQLRKNETSAKTINHVISAIKAIFGYAERTNIIEANSAHGIKPFKVETKEKGVFTREELTQLFNEPEQSKIWAIPQHYLLNCIAATTGLRLGEILALRPENINNNCINVNNSWNRIEGLKSTKTGKIRIVPISSELGKILKNYIEKYNVTGYLFSCNNGRTPIDHKIVYRHFYYALLKIGIDKEMRIERKISFHSFRHTFNTLLLEAGVYPETIRLITGHSANMTARYSHIQLNNMPSIIEKLPVLYCKE
jgi:integrase